MLVLHAYWQHVPARGLRLWAESSDQAHSSAPRRGKHPFAAPRDTLDMLVFNVYPVATEEAGTFGTATLMLPAAGRVPAPSPDLAVERAEGTCMLAPFDVPVLKLGAYVALDMMLGLPVTPPPGVAYGQDVRFWTECARLCIELVSRQCVLPWVVVEENDGDARYEGRWRVSIAGADTRRLHLLAQAMPSACRAWTPDGATQAPSALMQDFFDATADAFMREHLYEHAHYVMRPVRRARGVPLGQQWRASLTSERATLTDSPAALASFKRTVDAWLDAVRAQEEAAFRTCFKLDPPQDGSAKNARWCVSFHLQAKEDPSVMLPAMDVWTAQADAVTFLRQVFEQPQERLLASLGLAARVFPALEPCLDSPTPVSLDLSTDGAYEFMRATAPLLEQSGFAVMLPAWWNKPASHPSVVLRMRPAGDKKKVLDEMGTGTFGLDELVEFDWKLALGGQVLTKDEFDRIAALKVPLVQIRGQWVELRRDQIEQAIAFFDRQAREGPVSLGRALRTGLGGDDADVGMHVSRIEAEGALLDCFDRLAAHDTIEPATLPDGFKGSLRPYQERGVSWLDFLSRFGLGPCLADDMGLGKTVELIAYLLVRHARRPARLPASSRQPSLVIAPMSVVGNWQREIKKFAPGLRVMIHHGADRRAGASFEKQAARHDVVITTYALVQRDIEHLGRMAWDCIVVDEAQNIKNPQTKQTQAVKQLKAAVRIAMTGTPVENRLAELWSIMEFLNPGYLGGPTDFRTRFATPIERYHDTDKATLLKRLVQPFVLRRVKTDKRIISDLPEKNEMKVFCNLTREQATLYKAVVDDMLGRIEEADGIERRGLVLAALTKLKQVCNHPAHFLNDNSSLTGRSGKLARFEEMLDEAVEVGDKALVFTQFAEMGGLLQAHVRERFGREVLFLHGGTPQKQRDAMVARFQDAHSGAQVFVLSLKAGGVGLNLTAAQHVFHFDRWWNPAVENQATDRAFRIGQTRNVQVHKFVCAGTIEESIDEMIEQKKDLAERIVGAGEQWITELSTEKLREMFALSADAVSED